MENPKQITLDASAQTLGRLASTVAKYLRGKHLATFRPNAVPNVQVTVTHLSALRLTPKKSRRPVYRFSGYPGGLKSVAFGSAFTKNPDQAFRHVVQRMLPANKLRKRLLRRLRTTA